MVDKKQSIKDWKPILEKYEPLKVLGSGSYGHVIEAYEKGTKRKVAIKRINSLFEDLIDTKRILREITLLRFMKNQFIVELLDIMYDKDDDLLNILSDACQNSQKYIEMGVKAQEYYNNNSTVLHMAQGAMNAIEYVLNT